MKGWYPTPQRFKLCYYVYFLTNAPWERHEPPYFPSYGLNSSTTVLWEGWLWHLITYICHKTKKPNQSSRTPVLCHIQNKDFLRRGVGVLPFFSHHILGPIKKAFNFIYIVTHLLFIWISFYWKWLWKINIIQENSLFEK